MQRQDYYIVFHPLVYNLMDLMGLIETPLQILSYLTSLDANLLNADNYLEYLEFDITKKRASLVEILAIESYALLYIGNQIADAMPTRRVILCDGKRRTLQQIIRQRGKKPKAVFITAMSANFPTAVAVALVLNHARIPVVIGGIHVSTSPADIDTFIRDVCPHPALVTHVTGAGDRQTIARVLADVEKGRLQRNYRGYHLIENNVWGRRANVDPLPAMRIDALARIPVIGSILAQKMRIIPAAPFLGCPYACHFCSISSLPKKQRAFTIRDTEDFLDELESLQKSGKLDMRFIFFLPDNLLLGGKKLEDILHGIIRRKLKINFAAQVSIDIAANEALLRKLRQAGATHFFLGLESLDLRNLEYIGKHVAARIRNSGLSVDAYYAAQLKKIQSHGISAHGAFIFGLPYDYCRSRKENTAMEVADFCLKHHIGLQPASLTDLPGSRNFAESQREGTWLYGQQGTIEYLLGLCVTDLGEMNRVPPAALDHCPLTVAYLAYEAIRKAAETRHALGNGLYAFWKSFLHPTYRGRHSFKERVIDAFYSFACQLVVALYKEMGDQISYSAHGVRGIFERLHDLKKSTSSDTRFDDYVRKFSAPYHRGMTARNERGTAHGQAICTGPAWKKVV